MEGLDVERGVDECDGVVCCLLEETCESHERDEMALGHEGEENYVLSLRTRHCFWKLQATCVGIDRRNVDDV